MEKVTAWAPGICGELVQGVIDGNHVQVVCPIARYTRVTVAKAGEKVNICPKNSKLRDALQRGLAALGLSFADGLQVEISTELLRAKGFGSSSADISAGLAALARLYQREMTPEEIAAIALQVEPTDGLMFPGLHLFDHRRGRVSEALGQPPSMEVLVFDFGGEMDSIDFFQREDLEEFNKAKEGVVRVALALIRDGLLQGRPDFIARAATMSALANQEINPKEGLEELARLATSHLGALGLCIAHSGTIVGLLYPALDPFMIEETVREVTDRFGLNYLFHSPVIGGGLTLREPWEARTSACG
ncbi:MAG: GHMP kinase [Limnochordia bacterium]|jgi:L-threonine kinase